jgi:hypothetical protein
MIESGMALLATTATSFLALEPLLHQPAEAGQVRHLMHGRAKAGKIGQEFREIATRPCQAAQSQRRTIMSKFTFHELQQ